MKENNIALDVRVKALENGGKVKGYASVNIGGMYAVKGIRIIEGSKGLFVAMPNQKNHKGEYEDIFFPVTKEGRDILQNAVMTAYENTLEMAQEQQAKTSPELSM